MWFCGVWPGPQQKAVAAFVGDERTWGRGGISSEEAVMLQREL